MSWDAVSLWLLLAWFVALALAELRFGDHEISGSGNDARLLTNFTFAAVTLGASSLVPIARVGSSVFAQRLHLGIGSGLPWLAALAILMPGLTFVGYWIHRMMHATSLLWRVHRVHHADTLVDVSTSVRHHPLEILVTTPANALVIFLVGAPVSAVIASESLILATALLGHADVRLPSKFDRALAWLIVTPRLHRVHHHPDRRLHDSNYGDTFTIWDRLFGTFSDEPNRMPVGLRKQALRPDHLLDQVLSPLHAA